ncbi:MAG TPA: hypothetical protein VLI04_03500 [Nocardioidaceae bacterium]|nr:hypothetical protein [Nocardioidaceae bacterium]
MTRTRSRLLAAIVASSVIVAGGWALRDRNDEGPPSQAAPPTAPPDGFDWVGSGHVVVSVPEDWESDTTGCTEPPCGGDGGETRPTVRVGFTPEDQVSPRDEAVTIDGVAAVRSPVTCDGPACSGRILVPAEHVVVTVSGATEDEVIELLDGVHVLEDLAAVPETRYSEQPDGTDARRFREWAESLGLTVRYEEVDGDVPGQVLAAEPPTGTVVEVGSEVVAQVVSPVPPEPACDDLRLVVDGWQVYPFEEPVRIDLVSGEKLVWEATGACAAAVRIDDSDPALPIWLAPFCSGLDERAAATCAAGQTRIGSAVVTRSR